MRFHSSLNNLALQLHTLYRGSLGTLPGQPSSDCCFFKISSKYFFICILFYFFLSNFEIIFYLMKLNDQKNISQGLNGLCKHLLMVPPNHHIPIKKNNSKQTNLQRCVTRCGPSLSFSAPSSATPPHPRFFYCWPLCPTELDRVVRWQRSIHSLYYQLTDQPPASVMNDVWQQQQQKKIMNGTKSASREGNCPQTKSYIIEVGRMVRSVLWGVLEVVSF